MKQIHAPSLEKHIVKIVLLYVFTLYLLWTGAWLLERWLERSAGLPSSGFANVAYWTAMKLLLWLVPSLVLIRLSGRRIADVFGVRRIGRALLWGVGTGLALGILTMAIRLIQHRAVFSFDLSWSLLSGVAVSPIVEEITFRGAVLGALLTRFRFVFANLLTAALFLGSHLPGWYFQGTLAANLLMPVGGATSILVLGFIFGCVAKKSDSIIGSIFTHMLNNLFSM